MFNDYITNKEFENFLIINHEKENIKIKKDKERIEQNKKLIKDILKNIKRNFKGVV